MSIFKYLILGASTTMELFPSPRRLGLGFYGAVDRIPDQYRMGVPSYKYPGSSILSDLDVGDLESFRTDGEALRSDWLLVGADIRSATEVFDSELRR